MQKSQFIFDNFFPYLVTFSVYSYSVASNEHVLFFNIVFL